MVTIDKIEHGIAAYLDGELIPKLPSTGIEKVLTGTTMSLLIRRLGKILESYKNDKTVRMLEIVDEEGNVDIDLICEELKKNIPSEGVKMDVPIIGSLTFHEDDVDKLYEYITIL